MIVNVKNRGEVATGIAQVSFVSLFISEAKQVAEWIFFINYTNIMEL